MVVAVGVVAAGYTGTADLAQEANLSAMLLHAVVDGRGCPADFEVVL